MKIQLTNLGVLKQAEFELGELTIICGGNNTGKTYATYALFGFLQTWREHIVIEIPARHIEQLLADGVVHLDLAEYRRRFSDILAAGCTAYTKQLSAVFAAPKERFQESGFSITLEAEDREASGKYDRPIRTVNTGLFSITKAAAEDDLVVTLLVDRENLKIPRAAIEWTIADAIKEILFRPLFPRPSIASTERTGVAVFGQELNFTRNRLLEEMAQKGKTSETYRDHPLPVKNNVDLLQLLQLFATDKSFVSEHHPDVLAAFGEIIGGEYRVTRDDEPYYVPKGAGIELTMDASSSAVRSLLDIGFYLKHQAQPGDLMMVDEPELNLHPENQRRMARLFARLVNIGIKVFITTHSDYIVKELNTLVMLKQDQPYLKAIAERNGYRAAELMAADKIKVYIAEKAPVEADGDTPDPPDHTLTPAHIDPELGIEARSFDVTINDMNRIQEEIVWGGDA